MIGNNVAEYRKKLKISQRELGRRSELSGQMISKIENDNTIPSITTLTKLANALETTVNDLLGEQEKLSFETDTVSDILNILDYADDSITLDSIPLSREEIKQLQKTFNDALDLIRYRRLKNNESTDN